MRIRVRVRPSTLWVAATACLLTATFLGSRLSPDPYGPLRRLHPLETYAVLHRGAGQTQVHQFWFEQEPLPVLGALDSVGAATSVDNHYGIPYSLHTGKKALFEDTPLFESDRYRCRVSVFDEPESWPDRIRRLVTSFSR